jgi:hypothetical protein
MEEIFGEVIYSYTRAQAIEDGVLVDLTSPVFSFRKGLNICQEAGLKFPVAMTSAAFAETVGDERSLPAGQDISGRLWDVLWMLRLAIGRSQGGDLVFYDVLVWNGRKQQRVRLKAVCGPGDDAEPVITIMLRGED